mmetsp:Transcript_24831/g.41381  ORF Transcript_24831/g.41381 Transcript_24831/m.41381 type:complete len:266 (+) Transcript_24831:1107-1904(+)
MLPADLLFALRRVLTLGSSAVPNLSDDAEAPLRDGSCSLLLKQGSSQKNVLPRPSPSEVAPMIPPCISTIDLDNHRPSPDPPPFCNLLASNCTYCPNSLGRFSLEIPAPVSRTAIRIIPPSPSIKCFGLRSQKLSKTETVITNVPPDGVNLIALVMKLRTTCSILGRSTTIFISWWISFSREHLKVRLDIIACVLKGRTQSLTNRQPLIVRGKISKLEEVILSNNSKSFMVEVAISADSLASRTTSSISSRLISPRSSLHNFCTK